MNTMSSRQHLELSVSNFGPIAEGRIELRPMTVFVGPSNTGKSYLAILTYALHRMFSEYSEGLLYGSRRSIGSNFPEFSPQELTDNAVDEIIDWTHEVLGETGRRIPGGRFRGELPEPIEVPEPIANLTRTTIHKSTLAGEMLDSEISRCFGVGQTGELSTYPHGGLAQFSLSGKSSANDANTNAWELNFAASDQTIATDVSMPPDAPLYIRQRIRSPRYVALRRFSEDSPESNHRHATELLQVLANTVVAGMVGHLNRPAYYLPADRSGVMHAHHVVVRALIASASRGGIRHQVPLPVLSGVLGDFLEELIETARSESRIGRRYRDELAASLEKDLIKGSVNVRRDEIDYPSFVYRPAGWERDLPLMNASSMVSELAPVALYLRHVVRPGDTLIIEEPESHLHPEMQVAFLRQLAGAVKAGVRIIITTHSEWILEELANLVRLSDLPAKRRGGIAGADVALDWDQIGVWFFEPGLSGKGSTVREMPLDIEEGNFPSGFGLVTVDLYNRWAEISNRIEHEHNADHNSR